MSCSADYYLVTCSQRRLIGADVCSAHTSRRYQNRKCTAPSQFGIVGAANLQRRLVRAEHTSAHTITTVTHSQRRIVGAANVGSTDQAVLQDVLTHAAHTSQRQSHFSTDQQVLPMFTKVHFRAFFMGQMFRGDVWCASIQSTIVFVPSSAFAPPPPPPQARVSHNIIVGATRPKHNIIVGAT